MLDVVVRDHGVPVHGLDAEDFKVLEDGREQPITVFEEHKASDAVEASSKPPQLPPDTYSDAQPYAITSSANVLLLDALNTPLADQKYIRSRLLQSLRAIPPGTRIAVFTLGSKLRVVEGFTADSSVLQKALTEKSGNAAPSPVMDPLLDQTMSDAADIAGSGMADFATQSRSFELQLRQEITLDALTQLTRYLSTIPGRKNLIWVAGSFPFTVHQGEGPGAVAFGPDFQDPVQKLEELLTFARVAVYPIDPQGLTGTPSMMAESNITAPGLMNSVPGQSAQQTFSTKQRQLDQQAINGQAASRGAMDIFAKSTGGKAFYNTNAVADAVTAAIGIGSSYYTLGYSPANRHYDGAFRGIVIKAVKGQYELAYRPGYFAVDPQDPPKLVPGRMSPLIAAMQHGALPVCQVPFTVRVIPVSEDPATAQSGASQPNAGGMLATGLKQPVTRYVAEFSIDPAGVDFGALPNSLQHREIELTQVLYDSEGIRVNYNDIGLAVNTSAATKADSRIHLAQQIDVPAGQTFLRLGVTDRLSGRMGAIEIRLNVKH